MLLKDLKEFIKKLEIAKLILVIVSIILLFAILVIGHEAFEFRNDFSLLMLIISCLNTSTYITLIIILNKLEKIINRY